MLNEKEAFSCRLWLCTILWLRIEFCIGCGGSHRLCTVLVCGHCLERGLQLLTRQARSEKETELTQRNQMCVYESLWSRVKEFWVTYSHAKGLNVFKFDPWCFVEFNHSLSFIVPSCLLLHYCSSLHNYVSQVFVLCVHVTLVPTIELIAVCLLNSRF